MVVRITPSYPLRPVIRVTREKDTVAAVPRYLDLSLLPHLYVADTVDPPAVERVTFDSAPPMVQAAASPTSASEQFARWDVYDLSGQVNYSDPQYLSLNL